MLHLIIEIRDARVVIVSALSLIVTIDERAALDETIIGQRLRDSRRRGLRLQLAVADVAKRELSSRLVIVALGQAAGQVGQVGRDLDRFEQGLTLQLLLDVVHVKPALVCA